MQYLPCSTLRGCMAAAQSIVACSLEQALVLCAQLGCAVAIVLITYFKLSHITNFGVNLGQRACPRSLVHFF